MSSEIHALSGAYAVNAVNDLERAEFERHLAECSACQAEVASLREATVALTRESAVAPPPSLRLAVQRDVHRTRPLPPLAAATPDDRSPISTRTAPQEGGARRWFPALVAAAVLTVVGVGATVWQPWDRSEESSQTQLTASERVLQAPDAKEVTLEFPDGARATLTRSLAERAAVLTTRDMPLAPTGRVYELWLQHEDGSMSPAGVMPAKSDQTVLLAGDATEAVGAGITVEPEGGSEEPTSDPIALFDFTEAT